MFWIFMIVTITFVFILTAVVIDKSDGKKSPDHKKAASKKEVKGRTGTYDVKLFEVPSPYDDECFRVEFYQKSRLVHKNIDYLPEGTSYTEAIKHFTKKLDETIEKEQGRAASRKFDLETWDGDVYEDEAVDLPKKP
ncbi:hypothetical protein [Alkalicoccus saliphilus]|uniref:Uncharacterized protein n=1 Tax=Alkalicoccus saliphilus TaxID=200989 RepID=A0A2T4U9C5_9BACI|nr:hypothetical protein [Alkalicoccus saliphilus]PTL40004.1 hypothetical protein C6Y45_03255 [Alkalicoccus saliphilus]